MEDRLIKRITLFIVTLAAFIAPFNISAINIALPTIGREFLMDADSLGWVATAYLLSSVVFLVPFGKIADIYGRKKIFIVGIIIFSLASLSMTLCPSAAFLISFRVLQGFGSAMIFGTGIAILTSVFPPRERGKALGISVSSTYIGLTLGPFVGGILTSSLGWRSIFLVNIPLGIIIVILVLTKLKGDWSEAKGEKFDLAGSFFYCTGIIAIMMGVSAVSRLGNTVSIIMILLGAVIFYLFIRWEMRQESPVFDISLFMGNRVFTLSNLAALINYCATFATTFFLSLYLQYIKDFNPKQAGLILIAQPIVMAIASPFAGKLSDRIEPRKVASTGMAIIAVCLFLLALVNSSTSIIIIIIVLIFTGLGFAFFSSPNSNAVMSSVEKRYYGIASGALGTMRLMGQMFSMGITVLIFAIYIGHAQITPENYPAFLISMRTAFIFFGVLCSIGVVASLSRGNVR